MADEQQTHGTAIERVLQRRLDEPDRDSDAYSRCADQPDPVEKLSSCEPTEAQLLVDRRGWLATLAGVSWYLLHGASPARAAAGPKDPEIKRALIERLLNRRLYKPNDQVEIYLLRPEDHGVPAEKLIWYHPTETDLVEDRKKWFGKFTGNGKKEMRTDIDAEANHTYPHAKAPDDEDWTGGVLSSIKEGAQEAGKRDVFIDVYVRMRELIANIAKHEKDHVVEYANPVIKKAFEDGYNVGYADRGSNLPNTAAAKAAAYVPPNWPPPSSASAHYTY